VHRLGDGSHDWQLAAGREWHGGAEAVARVPMAASRGGENK
jgi:hypothetical protein